MSGPHVGRPRYLGRRGRRRLLWAGAVVAVLLLITSGAVAWVSWEASTGLIQPPRHAASNTPADVGLAYEDFTFATADDVVLAGWWMPALGAPVSFRVVVFLHGWGDSRNQSLEYAPFLGSAGWNVFAFDFRAHGESGGTTTTVGLREVLDVEAALGIVEARAAGADATIVLFGVSMGGAAALNAAADPRVDAVVVESAFAELGNVAKNSIQEFTGLPKWPFGPLSVQFASWRLGVDVGDNRPAEAVRGLGKPVLVIQGADDRVVRPEDDGQRIADAVGETATYWLVPDAPHVKAHSTDPLEYELQVLVFLTGVAAR